MCGIAGLVTHNAPLRAEDRADVERMTSYMQARGPEGEGFWSSTGQPQAQASATLVLMPPATVAGTRAMLPG